MTSARAQCACAEVATRQQRCIRVFNLLGNQQISVGLWFVRSIALKKGILVDYDCM